ncbi:MAG: nucleotidyl transferase AbiEii/AbiGii toxin family protein [Acidimicrobiales bacterium]
MLSPLQQRIATIIASLPEAEDFALAGGAALIVHGAVERTTHDLDFFGLEPGAVDRLAPAAERALRAGGLSVERLLTNPGFVRLLVATDDERTEVDLGSDARLFPVDQGPGFSLLTTEELAVDKVLAVFGRAEARDFMDLMAVEDRFGLDRLLAIAAEKDHGFDLIVFSDMTDRFGRLRRDEFPLDDQQYGRLSRLVRVWRSQARELAREQGRVREPGRDHGGDLGIGF